MATVQNDLKKKYNWRLEIVFTMKLLSKGIKLKSIIKKLFLFIYITYYTWEDKDFNKYKTIYPSIYQSIYIALYLLPSIHRKIRTISSKKLPVLLPTNLSLYMLPSIHGKIRTISSIKLSILLSIYLPICLYSSLSIT